MSNALLPPISQRPQIISRFELPALQTNNTNSTQTDVATTTKVEGASTQVVPRSNFIQDMRFTQETPVQKFRGETQGREVDMVAQAQSLSTLPDQVQPFNPLTAQGGFIQSLNPAEAAAVGATKPTIPTQDVPTPPISGSGEVFNERAQEALASVKGNNTIGTNDEGQNDTLASTTVTDEQDEQNVSNQNSNDTNQLSSIVPANQSLVEQVRQEEEAEEDQQQVVTLDQKVQENNIVEKQQQNQQTNLFVEEDNAEKRSNGIATTEELTLEEQTELKDLKRRDQEVRSHEQAHASSGGQHVTGAVQYQYVQGPDGKRYVTDGEVNIDVGPEATPEATIAKMQQVRRAALAPSDPSGADRAVAAIASQREQQARAELAEQREDEFQQRAEENRENRQIERAENDAGSTKGIDSGESLAAVQSVEPVKVERPGVNDQRSLDSFESYPLSSPDASFSRAVEGLVSSEASSPNDPAQKSMSLENSKEGYDLALDKALSTFTGIEED